MRDTRYVFAKSYLISRLPAARRDVGIPPYGSAQRFQSCIVGRPDPRPPLVQTADLYCSKIQHSRLPNYLSLRRPLAACGNPFSRREQLRFKFVIGKHVRIRSLFFDIAIPTARSTGCHATQAHWLAMTALYYSPRFRQKLFDIVNLYKSTSQNFNPSAEPTHFLFTFHSSLLKKKFSISFLIMYMPFFRCFYPHFMVQ